jgi:Pin2-interacting protein X1
LLTLNSRTKISKDPNNTNWSRNTSRFGHRILRTQGWEPGQNLGLSNSTYGSQHHTNASASHIRVKLRDGNLGIGAKLGRNDDTFGLELLSSLLGRINGKTDEQLGKESALRRDIKLLQYQEQKKGLIGFTFGGYLVGDEIQETLKNQGSPSNEEEEPETETIEGTESREERRKRKAERRAKKEAKRLKREGKKSKKSKGEANQKQDVAVIAKEVPRVVAFARGRHVIRQRHIQQKNLASLDEKSLNEVCISLLLSLKTNQSKIFMIKSSKEK